ncbi:class I SAM-dependent methyltransferase [Selenomonas felix]|uniref:class I SAM-dependent methyltransferase n=1 Tax=Selenomonas felix TaxID=1944634 RepID=UPI003081139F
MDYSFFPRRDLMSLMDFSKAGLRVLEIGCACGATLREIGAQNPSVRLYGVELNEKAAEIAAPYATILSMDVERLDPSQVAERFDYIVMGDVIEHLQNPWKAIENMRELLAPGGEVIASIPNVGHISNLYEVLSGNWTYKSMGLLDRTHLRFFTKKEIIKLFQEAQFDIQDMRYVTVPYPDIGERLREELLSLQTISVDAEDLDAYQWLVRAKRV